METLEGKIKRSVCINERAFMLKDYIPIMPALCLVLNSAYYANNYTGIFNAGLQICLH